MRKQITVQLTNRVATFDCTKKTLDRLRDHWSYYPNGYRWSPKHTMWLNALAAAKRKGIAKEEYTQYGYLPGWDGKIRMLSRGRLPAGLFRATYEQAEEALNITFNVETNYPRIEFVEGFSEDSAKYQYQNDCVDAMCSNLVEGGGIILSATGTGKTKIAAQFFSKIPKTVKNSRRKYYCLFVVDTIDLLYQSQTELASWLNEPIGIVGNSKFALERITVATIQTLHKHIEDPIFADWFDTIDVVLVDELHTQLSKRNFSVLSSIEPIAIYGLTATLQLQKKEIRMKAHAFAGPVIYTFPVAEAMEQDILTKGEIVQLLFPPVHENVECYVNWQDELNQEVIVNKTKHEAYKAIVEYLLTQTRSVIALVERRLHVRALHGLMSEVPHRRAFGPTSSENRAKAIRMFEEGKINHIIASKIFQKGVNIKRVDTMIDMAEGKSRNNALQKFGRGVRLHKDKESLLYIDFGTQGKGRFGKAAKIRARAFRKAAIKVNTRKVATVKDAIAALKKFIEK